MTIMHRSGHYVASGEGAYRSQHKARCALVQRLKGLLWRWPKGPVDDAGVVRTYSMTSGMTDVEIDAYMDETIRRRVPHDG